MRLRLNTQCAALRRLVTRSSLFTFGAADAAAAVSEAELAVIPGTSFCKGTLELTNLIIGEVAHRN